MELTLFFTEKESKMIHLKRAWGITLLFIIDIMISFLSLMIIGGGSSIFGLQILILVNAFTTIFGKRIMKTSQWYGKRV